MATETKTSASLVPRVDIYENRAGLLLLAELPGVRDADVDLQVEKNSLVLRARAQGITGQPTWSRSFLLPRDVDSAAVGAELKDGVLSITIPRRAEMQPRRVAVQAVS